MLQFTEITQGENRFTRIRAEEYDYAYGYFTRPVWVDNDRLVMGRRSVHDDPASGWECDLVLVDLKKRTEQPIGVRCTDVNNFTVCNGILYYVDPTRTLIRRDLTTGEERKLLCREHISMPHITNDGAHVSLMLVGKPECYAIVMDSATGEIEWEYERHFSKPFTVADHQMICPTDPNRAFFSHEGDTFYISNRLWLAEKGKEARCLVKQKLNEIGELGDCCGHECWTPDGKGLYYIKYDCAPTPPRGICYADADLTMQPVNVLYSAFPYWHVCCSPDGTMLASDTQSGDYSGVCLIDMKTGTERMLARTIALVNHPGHPHPVFSPDCRRLLFHDVTPEGRITVGILDLTAL